LDRKNLDYEFPTSRSGKKRLVAGIETLVQDGHSLDDTWPPGFSMDLVPDQLPAGLKF